MKIILILLFFLAFALRLMYFPENIYFAYDQARDSFTSLEILKGDLKIVGPPSAASDKLFPGPLIFYLYAPVYFLFDKNPEAIAIFLRVFNSIGVVFTYFIGKAIFNKRVGLLSALFFTVSWEATQYSLFLSHQALAVVTVLLFYLGISILVFNRNKAGILLAALGAGLSIQFHYIYIFLLPLSLLIFFVFREKIFPLNIGYTLTSIIILSLTLSSYVVSEIKFSFRTTTALISTGSATTIHWKETLATISRFVHDNIWSDHSTTSITGIILVSTIVYFLFKKEFSKRIVFLILWFLIGLIPYLLSGTPSYYYAAGTAVSIFIFCSFLITQLYSRKKILGIGLFLVILFNNLYSIFTLNKLGPNPNFIIQPGMLLSDEKRALDYIYSKAGKNDFSVGALTIPLNIKTTWSYIFEWYGKQTYGYLPPWVGPSAEGHPGNLLVVSDRSKLPENQFLIIEPTVGIREAYKVNFFKEEGYFTKVIEEKEFGKIIVQQRQKI